MTEEFRNAYHFIARKAKAGRPFPNAKHFGKDDNHSELGHAVYVKDCLSGTIHCRITLEQPTVIGGLREGANPPTIKPFVFDNEPAIPATSLKGLISSLAEAASQSAYRILSNPKLTVGYGFKNADRATDIGTLRDYVPPELRPSNMMTMADQIFGFVRKPGANDPTLAGLAGRLRFSHGLLSHTPIGGLYQAKVRLKELGQPMKDWPDKKSGKPAIHRSATPNFYMKEKDGASQDHISKEAFAKGGAASFEVQGQKAYLHHAASSNPDAQPFKTNRTNERQSFVTPLRAGTQFTFNIRFDNLSEAELDLLCFAILPSKAFRHKIGYGKPLGLGSVRIDLIGLMLVDRGARYTNESVFAETPIVSEPLAAKFGERVFRHTTQLKASDPAALNAILLIGETHDFGGVRGDGVPVLWVPLTSAKFNTLANPNGTAEDRSFEWFQNNDISKAQRLVPITEHSTQIRPLQTNEKSNAPQGGNAKTHTAKRTAPAPPALGRARGTITTPTPGKSHRHIKKDGGGRDIIVPTEWVNKVLGGLSSGDRVEFSERNSDRGMIAIDIKRI